MVRKTKEEAAITRQALLNAALSVFSRQGYAATRLEDIAEEAGVTRGAIYHHFGSKPELYNEMIAEYNKPLMQIVQDALDEGGTVSGFLRNLFISMCTALEDDDDIRAIQEIVTTKTELTSELKEGIARKNESMSGEIAYLSNGMKTAIANGELRGDLDADAAAMAYFSLLNGYALLWLLDQSAFSIKARAPQMIDIFLRGLLP